MKRIVFFTFLIALVGGIGFLMFYQPAPQQQKIEKTLDNAPAAK